MPPRPAPLTRWSRASFEVIAADTALGVTLNSKNLKKPLREVVIEPFINEFNARNHLQISIVDVEHVEINGERMGDELPAFSYVFGDCNTTVVLKLRGNDLYAPHNYSPASSDAGRRAVERARAASSSSFSGFSADSSDGKNEQVDFIQIHV